VVKFAENRDGNTGCEFAFSTPVVSKTPLSTHVRVVLGTILTCGYAHVCEDGGEAMNA